MDSSNNLTNYLLHKIVMLPIPIARGKIMNTQNECSTEHPSSRELRIGSVARISLNSSPLPRYASMKRFWGILLISGLGACSPLPAAITPIQTVNIAPTDSEFTTYRDVANQFEMTYSKSDFEIDPYKDPEDTLSLLLNVQENFDGQNLEEVRVSIGVNSDCNYIQGHGLTASVEALSIKGIDFTKYSTRDSGSSTNIFETITYATIHNNKCYEIHISIREYRLDAFPNLTEYSRGLLDTKLERLIASFKFSG